MTSLTKRAVVCGLIVTLGLLSALPSVLPSFVSRHLPDWYADTTLSLGLDLRGGSQLLLNVDTAAVVQNEHQQLTDQLREQLRKNRLAYRTLTVSPEGPVIALRNAADMDPTLALVEALIQNPDTGTADYSVRRNGEVITMQPSPAFVERLAREAVERSLDVVRKRLNESGLVDPTIVHQGAEGILVQLPGVEDPAHIRALLGTTAQLTFHWVADAKTPADRPLQNLPYQASATTNNTSGLTIEQDSALAGKHIRDARLAYNPETNEPVVSFTLDRSGARLFADLSANNLGRALAIVLDGQVITAPVIRSVIGGQGEISGAFSATEASDLALLLRAGALPAPLEVAEERTVGPELGSDAISMGISTGVLGTALVFAFMLAVYGRWGVIACLALGVNIGLVFGVLSLLGATLTLPGIAGLILSIGMAVDANILINERIREESRRGRSPLMALDAGFKRAFRTILDSNITTLIAISLLFMVGSGPVRGFAVTMGIGLLVSLFTAIFFTRVLMEWRLIRRGRQPLSISGLAWLDRVGTSSLDVMRHRWLGLSVSALLSLASVALFFGPGLTYGIDFSGGYLLEIAARATSLADLRATLEPAFHQIMIQPLADTGNYLLRLPLTQTPLDSPIDLLGQLKGAVTDLVPGVQVLRAEMVGPKVSGSFADMTVLAILLAGLGMLAYLWLRYETHFAIATVVTLALDITKTLGFFSLTGIEFNLTAVAAILALIGYSVNDKVVVFDRVRELLQAEPDRPLADILNASIRSTLTRTVFTSVTTGLALLPMALAGGSAVASFAVPMVFGILVGTSSSLFIAAPLLLLLGERRSRHGLGQLRLTPEQTLPELATMP